LSEAAADGLGTDCDIMRMFKRFLSFPIALGLLLVFATGMAAAEGRLKPFESGSLAEILKSREGQPFILMFWSVDCASCMQELDAMSASLKKHPGLNLVMIATDDAAMSGPVLTMLAKHGLGEVESWIFGGASAQKLRYEVDPAWFGELPRSYFYDQAHQRLALSGALTERHLDAWMTATRP